MSYRAFKRLLGETSLERKCRFLFGAGILVLITLSFGLYAYQTEHLTYEQADTTSRLLVNPSLTDHMLANQSSKGDKKLERMPLELAQYLLLSESQNLDGHERELFKE